ncbi:ArsR/SmtB family transcription factor [Staphylococcus delphini]|uniref:ArsR/SmtB family transcription factor n=1 Tax=Staphylococcus delphini TaxID=53344 RepID=UPI0023B2AFAC|nr:metalloregulator ArsR/SmtB family transcription factor [Staphylococcus delphini]MDE9753332.1 metalloregulator ArsR/SmtB family transcription factor [Staphylococcus delphini]MDE9790477.1 metalloregulator ArsR/SmtB family transcription factor [Staphylococcus delphini]MDE9792793.1 metalloregulator ArsR/SmtB family transcription factor [Staphylococcus delphini]MDE9793978.1 metalloregulator ArsR/SmtB family transcription factor [Staphylococcus delphini]MDE9796884.1 metalloregulator ArsR/SmtB fam
MSYQALSKILKVLSDPSRLEILDILSCGELCACDLLAHFQFSQPTLSYHMKALVDNELVFTRKSGNKRMYRLNHALLEAVNANINFIHTAHERCICHDIKSGECGA